MHGNEKKNLDVRLEGFIWGLGWVNPAIKSGIQFINLSQNNFYFQKKGGG